MIADGPRRPEPWLPGDATRLVTLNLLGLMLIVLGWVGVSGTGRVSRQFGWTAFAIAGLLVACFGNALWLMAGRRAVGMRRKRLLADRRAGASAPGPGHDGQRSADADVLVAAPDMTRYHRPGCLLVRDKPVRDQRRSAHERARRRPCEVCRP